MDSKIKARQIIVLAVGMFIFTLGFGVIIPVMPYYANNLGATALDLGLLMATFSAMQFVCAPVWGAISDRIGRKPVMMIGLTGFGLAFTVTGLSSEPAALAISEVIGHWTGLSPHIGVLFISEVIGGTLSSGIWPATLAFIADITKPEERGNLMGQMGAASGLGVIIGPAISGFLTSWSLTLPFFATAGIGFLTAVLAYLLLPESRVPGQQPEVVKKVSMLSAIKTSLGFIFILTMLISFAGAMIDGTFGYFLMGKFGLSDQPGPVPLLFWTVQMTGPGVMGVVFAFMGITGVVCQGLLVGKAISTLGEQKTIIAGLIIYSAGIIAIYFSVGIVTLALFTCLIEVGFGLIFPSLNTLVSKRTDPDRQGEMLGVMGSFNSLGRVIGPPAGGLMFAVHIGLPYFVSGILGFIAAGVMAMLTRAEKRKAEILPTSVVKT
ncbi:MFS transporter [Methanocella arvoryzae]|uniref:Permease (Major facilitator superfamily) n=1 Tax=Methanocella arvoryzae (strain DSM 22066 / NBRC 105507 / MRE50) TaxID=351160 RepID=Q0W0C7_METAR|nr:MFS transporter [Methanocella arvoryzae]CAJ38166.1 putative permease (major facilitator superfamily) [Methanocella arvoryzae MRE50]